MTGFLVPAGSIDALVDGMTQILAAEPTALWRLGHEGAARVRVRHDASIEAGKLSKFFSESIVREQSMALELKAARSPAEALASNVHPMEV